MYSRPPARLTYAVSPVPGMPAAEVAVLPGTGVTAVGLPNAPPAPAARVCSVFSAPMFPRTVGVVASLVTVGPLNGVAASALLPVPLHELSCPLRSTPQRSGMVSASMSPALPISGYTAGVMPVTSFAGAAGSARAV